MHALTQQFPDTKLPLRPNAQKSSLHYTYHALKSNLIAIA